MPAARQFSFLPRVSTEHGGETRLGKRKIARPIDPKRPLHVVLRSSQARGNCSLLAPKTEKRISELLHTTARKYGIRVYRFANVGNHLHLMLQLRTRTAFRAFIRELTGRIAALVTGARKSHGLTRKFWDFIPYSRIVSWGRELDVLHRYFIKNLFEAAGLYGHRAKKAGLRVIILSAQGPPQGHLASPKMTHRNTRENRP